MFGRLNFLKPLFTAPLNNIVSSSSISTLIGRTTSSSLINSSRQSNISVGNKINNGVMSQCFEIISRGMANHRHKKVIKQAKGFRGRANRCFTVAYHRVQKALQYSYRDRKVK
jgi:beta-mannanase